MCVYVHNICFHSPCPVHNTVFYHVHYVSYFSLYYGLYTMKRKANFLYVTSDFYK